MSTFTEREQKLMAAACQSFEGEPKVCVFFPRQSRTANANMLSTARHEQGSCCLFSRFSPRLQLT